MRTRVVGTLVSVNLVATLSAAPARAEFIVNGSFEQPAITQGFQNVAAPSTEVTGWAVNGGSVDLVRDTFRPSFQGNQSLDLVGTPLGRID